MNTHPSMPMPAGSMAAAAVAARAGRPIAPSWATSVGLTPSGVWLFLTSLLVIGSGFSALRPEIMGLRLHPYLVPVGLAFPIVLLTRIQAFPMKILVALSAFVGMYLISVCNGTNIAISEVFKIGSALVTIITCALLVRRRGDFVAAILGLSIAVGILAYNGLTQEAVAGVDAMEGANKNSYSLFALPAILMAGYIAVWMKTTPTYIKGILVTCAVPALIAIFLSANRSGYIGALLVGLLLFWNHRGRGMFLVAAMVAVVAYGVMSFGGASVMNQRLKQTVEGNESDEYRKLILISCWEIGLDNLLIGVSPQRLPFEVGRRTSVMYHYSYVYSHNVYAHLFAGSGVLCLLALFAVGVTMWKWKPSDGYLGGDDDPARDARRMMRMIVILWFVRAAFTHEILYNPSFNITIGLAIGLAVVAETAHQECATRRPRRTA